MLISVHLTPKAKIVGVRSTMADGTLKVSVRSAPEDGKANAELCEVLAKHFGVPKTAISIVRGHTSRKKVVCVLLQ